MKHLVCEFAVADNRKAIHFTVIFQDAKAYEYAAPGRNYNYHSDGDVITVRILSRNHPDITYDRDENTVRLFIRGRSRSKSTDMVYYSTQYCNLCPDFIIDALKAAIDKFNKGIDLEASNS